MKAEPISKTIEAVLWGLSSAKKEARYIVYEMLLEALDEKEKKHAQPLCLEKKILTLNVDSPAWMYSLNLKKARLLKTLQEKVGSDVIKEIRLKIGILKG